ncbi:hypothetical protein BGP75_18325 [Motiliproteus sp. MSK22-1]|nr:hypothetical protein BGP75_18325 [Motiliproteus sp. MSK22-1]
MNPVFLCCNAKARLAQYLRIFNRMLGAMQHQKVVDVPFKARIAQPLKVQWGKQHWKVEGGQGTCEFAGSLNVIAIEIRYK